MLDKIGLVLREAFLPVSLGGVLTIGGLFASGYLSIGYLSESLGEARVEWFRDHLDWFFLIIFGLIAVNLVFNVWKYVRARKATTKQG